MQVRSSFWLRAAFLLNLYTPARADACSNNIQWLADLLEKYPPAESFCSSLYPVKPITIVATQIHTSTLTSTVATITNSISVSKTITVTDKTVIITDTVATSTSTLTDTETETATALAQTVTDTKTVLQTLPDSTVTVTVTATDTDNAARKRNLPATSSSQATSKSKGICKSVHSKSSSSTSKDTFRTSESKGSTTTTGSMKSWDPRQSAWSSILSQEQSAIAELCTCIEQQSTISLTSTVTKDTTVSITITVSVDVAATAEATQTKTLDTTQSDVVTVTATVTATVSNTNPVTAVISSTETISGSTVTVTATSTTDLPPQCSADSQSFGSGGCSSNCICEQVKSNPSENRCASRGCGYECQDDSDCNQASQGFCSSGSYVQANCGGNACVYGSDVCTSTYVPTKKRNVLAEMSDLDLDSFPYIHRTWRSRRGLV